MFGVVVAGGFHYSASTFRVVLRCKIDRVVCTVFVIVRNQAVNFRFVAIRLFAFLVVSVAQI